MTKFRWEQINPRGYECSSLGDKRFSALYAKLDGNRTIEQIYQCDIKAYDVGGTNWKLGKGKPSLNQYPGDQQYELYKSLWRIYLLSKPGILADLLNAATEHDHCLTDRFATGQINQARALAEILNEWTGR